MEGFALDPGQGEDRHIDEGDDHHPEQGGADHFAGGGARQFEPFLSGQDAPQTMLGLTKATQAVLDDDDGAVDDQAEVQRPQAHQIARGAGAHHARDRHQHGDGDDRRRDQGGADVSEQEEEDDDDEQGAFDQVLLDRLDGPLDEVGPVIDRRRLHPLGQGLGGFLQAGRGGLGHDAAVLARQHQDGGQHRLLAVLGRGPRP